jgi:retinol dehydrogenase 14
MQILDGMTRTVLITGATDGIGRATAHALAREGWHVLVHGRSVARLRNTIDALKAATGNSQIDDWPADFTDLSATRALGAMIADNYERLDAVIHNAATIEPERTLTAVGHERTLAVNHIAPFALQQTLEALLRNTAAQHGEARVLITAANGHMKATFDFADPHAATGYQPITAYQRSKLANVWWMKALARNYAGAGVAVNAFHPGVIGTKLLMRGFGIGGASVEDGAATAVKLASDPALRGVSGVYFDGPRERKSVAAADDAAQQAQLWALSEVWARA